MSVDVTEKQSTSPSDGELCTLLVVHGRSVTSCLPLKPCQRSTAASRSTSLRLSISPLYVSSARTSDFRTSKPSLVPENLRHLVPGRVDPPMGYYTDQRRRLAAVINMSVSGADLVPNFRMSTMPISHVMPSVVLHPRAE